MRLSYPLDFRAATGGRLYRVDPTAGLEGQLWVHGGRVLGALVVLRVGIVSVRSGFIAMQTSFHLARTRRSPRMLNWRVRPRRRLPSMATSDETVRGQPKLPWQAHEGRTNPYPFHSLVASDEEPLAEPPVPASTAHDAFLGPLCPSDSG